MITRDKTGRELLAYQYRYDNNGNRLRRKEVTEYRYDERNRLLEETLHKVTEGGERSQAFVHTYAYDIDGNLINEESPEEIRNYLYNGFRQISTAISK